MDITDTTIHTYVDPGTFTVTLTVEDDDGDTQTDTYSVQILTASEAADMIKDLILDLHDGAFKDKADKRKDGFEKMFSSIDKQISKDNYLGAIYDLVWNIRIKADGQVDGLSNNDWITDAVAQEDICWKIDELVDYLQTLL